MLVHLVEEGLVDSNEAELLVRHYLKGHPDIDTLILGCTHYPFLRHVVDRVLDNKVTLVSCADAVSDRDRAQSERIVDSRFHAAGQRPYTLRQATPLHTGTPAR